MSERRIRVVPAIGGGFAQIFLDDGPELNRDEALDLADALTKWACTVSSEELPKSVFKGFHPNECTTAIWEDDEGGEAW